MNDVFVRGTGMTRFGRWLERSMKDLGREAVEATLADAEAVVGGIDAIFFANSLGGLITGQECIRGEVIAYPLGFGTIPIHNVENACASGGNALHLAWMAVASGMYETVLALGVEKANHEDRTRTFSTYRAGTDIESMFEVGEGAGTDRTPLVDRQAALAKRLMETRGMSRGRVRCHRRQGLRLRGAQPDGSPPERLHRRRGARVPAGGRSHHVPHEFAGQRRSRRRDREQCSRQRAMHSNRGITPREPTTPGCGWSVVCSVGDHGCVRDGGDRSRPDRRRRGPRCERCVRGHCLDRDGPLRRGRRACLGPVRPHRARRTAARQSIGRTHRRAGTRSVPAGSHKFTSWCSSCEARRGNVRPPVLGRPWRRWAAE